MSLTMDEIFIGTDIVSVARIKAILHSSKKGQFCKRVFTKSEVQYCNNKPNPAIHYAGRFAAKEALIKAISSSGNESMPLNSIEIKSNINGEPIVNFDMTITKFLNCKVSISHTEEYATAFAILSIS
jgi:holo-[acyl-carrier protein] synthase